MAKNNNFSGGLFSGKKPTPLAVKESCVQSTILEYLDRRRIFSLRLNCGVAFKGSYAIQLCPEGTPDIECIYRGVPLFIEVKKYGEKPTQIQLDRHAEIRASGGVVIVAYKLEDVIAALKTIDSNSRN